MITIRAIPPSGFRRAGVFHPAEKVEHHDEDFSQEEVQQLLGEKQLVVEVSPDSDWAKLAGVKSSEPPKKEPAKKDPPADAAKA